MSVVTLRSETPVAGIAAAGPSLQRAHGAAEVVFSRRGDETTLTHLYQQTPCRVLFPWAEPGDPALAVLLTTSGGLTGGDSLRIQAAATRGAAMTLTTQAAEKLYRSLGSDTTIAVDLAVEEDAYLEC